MYIFELISKLFKPEKDDFDIYASYDPLKQQKMPNDEDECAHEFMPVDSSGETLACIKCGFIVQRSSIKEVKHESDY